MASEIASRRPALDPLGIVLALVAGGLATLAFDVFGQRVSPALGFPGLSPVPLAAQTISVVFGNPGWAGTGGTVLHWLTGVVVYPIAYVLIALPVARGIIGTIPWIVVAAVYGVVLWAFALYVMAHLVAGNPPFLGFGALTWVALSGHVIYGIALGLVLSLRR